MENPHGDFPLEYFLIFIGDGVQTVISPGSVRIENRVFGGPFVLKNRTQKDTRILLNAVS